MLTWIHSATPNERKFYNQKELWSNLITYSEYELYVELGRILHMNVDIPCFQTFTLIKVWILKAKVGLNLWIEKWKRNIFCMLYFGKTRTPFNVNYIQIFPSIPFDACKHVSMIWSVLKCELEEKGWWNSDLAT